MKLQALLTTLYYLLFSSSAKQINETIKGARDARAPKSTTIYHNGHPVEVHNIPHYSQHFQGIQALASNLAPNKAESGPKIALQRDKVVIQNENSYLQDSYGNRYYNPPQQLAYKTIFPQQFVSLQQLPNHFSQPLLGPAHSKQAYSLPQFSFAEPFNRPAIHQPLSESVVFDFPKTRQSFPLVLPPQHLNVPIQSHYKIAETAPFIAGNHQIPVTYSFHPSPAQRFVNFAPETHNHHNSATNLHTNAQPSSTVISQNIQEHQKHYPRAPAEGITKPIKKLLKKDEGKPIHASQELKAIDPKYLKPQVFSNSIVPAVQQFLPEIQNVLKYSIFPRQHFPQQEPDKRAQQQEGPFENRVKQIVTRPEKNHNVVINEYAPPEKHELKEEVKAEVIDEEENEEKTFNEGYQEAAKGFPAYSSYNDDYEKKIYDEASYGEPHYHESLNFGPPSDEPYPSDPEEHSSKYINKESLPHNAHDDDDSKEFRPIPYFSDNKKHSSPKGKKPSGKWSKQSERYKHPKTSSKSERGEQEIPYHYTAHQHPEGERHKSPSKSARYEIDYSNGFSPPHSDGHRQHTHRPEYHTHRSHVDPPASRFVEPQYQYGFEPIEARADSEELASSTSNVAVESDLRLRPSTNKKVYKENWFISKTSSTEAGADS